MSWLLTLWMLLGPCDGMPAQDPAQETGRVIKADAFPPPPGDPPPAGGKP